MAFTLPAGETLEGRLTIAGIGPETEGLSYIGIPVKNLPEDSRKGFIIFTDIPIPKKITQ